MFIAVMASLVVGLALGGLITALIIGDKCSFLKIDLAHEKRMREIDVRYERRMREIAEDSLIVWKQTRTMHNIKNSLLAWEDYYKNERLFNLPCRPDGGRDGSGMMM